MVKPDDSNDPFGDRWPAEMAAWEAGLEDKDNRPTWIDTAVVMLLAIMSALAAGSVLALAFLVVKAGMGW